MAKKLHILFLCSWYPSKEFPTNGDFIQRHAEAVSLQHKVSVLHIVSSKKPERSFIEEKLTKNLDTYIGYTKHTNNTFLKTIRFYKLYLNILKKIGEYDLIHVNRLFPLGVFALHQKFTKNKPFIISEHWTGYHSPQNKQIGFVEKFWSIRITKNATAICPVTNNLKNSMQTFGLKGNYKIVPNVVDTEIFYPTKKENSEFTILHVSSLNDTHKNISGMLRVAKKLEENIEKFTWKFVGGSINEYQNLLSKLQFKTAKIEFINHTSQKEIAKLMQQANVFVLFSNFENLPCVILESFSCGLPVISTNAGGIQEFFPNKFGELIEKKNEDELLKSLLNFENKNYANPQNMHQYAVQNFSKKAISDTFSKIYSESL